jgi:predicted nucleic acid-binding protein
MPASRRLVYWDSCVFIDYVQKKEARIATLNAIVEEARQGKYTIVTSALSIAEVVYGENEKDPSLLDPANVEAINNMWRDQSIISVTEFHPGIGEDARDLIRRGWVEERKLVPLDAVHLATAVTRSVNDFHTYDSRLLAWAGIWFPIREPTPMAHQLTLPNP